MPAAEPKTRILVQRFERPRRHCAQARQGMVGSTTRQRRDARARFFHDTGKLVTGYERHPYDEGADAAFRVVVGVGTADARPRDADDDRGIRRRRLWPVLHAEIAGAVQDPCLHSFLPFSTLLDMGPRFMQP
jgi:hypothetical protein